MKDQENKVPVEQEFNGILPISGLSSHNWWEVAEGDDNVIGGSSIATQSQCSSSGGGNGRCGSHLINRDNCEISKP